LVLVLLAHLFQKLLHLVVVILLTTSLALRSTSTQPLDKHVAHLE